MNPTEPQVARYRVEETASGDRNYSAPWGPVCPTDQTRTVDVQNLQGRVQSEFFLSETLSQVPGICTVNMPQDVCKLCSLVS